MLAAFPYFLLVICDISSGIGPCFPLAEVFYKGYANTRGERLIQRQLLLVQYKQQATFIYEKSYSTCD
jgi:hypothetical protein